MRKFIKEVTAAQYGTDEIKGLEMSSGFKPSGHWSDRFIEEPDEKKPYVRLGNFREYLSKGDWVVYKDGKIFEILCDHDFKIHYKEI